MGMGLQRTAARSRQRGLSFIGVIFVGVLAVAAFAIGGQSVPVFIEYAAIKRNDKVVVSFSYSREIPLAGPAYLVYRFKESTN